MRARAEAVAYKHIETITVNRAINVKLQTGE